jgi:hypothetical protein
MSTVDNRNVCPKCGYGRFAVLVGCCPRCGSSYVGHHDEEGNWVWVVDEQQPMNTRLGTITERRKGVGVFQWGTYDAPEMLADFKAELVPEDHDVAYYTYERDGVWYVHNLLTDEHMPATEASLEGIRWAGYDPVEVRSRGMSEEEFMKRLDEI